MKGKLVVGIQGQITPKIKFILKNKRIVRESQEGNDLRYEQQTI